jgi:FKBP-type peptidyl-prolyl cis-trans isomerase SlyD
MTISKDNAVLINFSLKNDKGEMIDTSEGREPLAYLHGHGNLLPGLEDKLEGEKEGGKVNATFGPSDAYGEFDPKFIQQVPISNFNEKEMVQVGAQFQVQMEEGVGVATITALDGEEVTVDMNHPLAGQTLTFDVEIVEVREATSEELEHGHVHGPGGHEH